MIRPRTNYGAIFSLLSHGESYVHLYTPLFYVAFSPLNGLPEI